MVGTGKLLIGIQLLKPVSFNAKVPFLWLIATAIRYSSDSAEHETGQFIRSTPTDAVEVLVGADEELALADGGR